MFKRRFLPWLAERAGPWLIESLGSSLSWEVRGKEHWESVRYDAHVLVFWHSRMLLTAYHFRHRGYHIVASENVDGELAARMVWRMGVGTLRGSTSRGAARVLISAARMLRSGKPVAFTPDGPRGPRHVFQAGAISAARMGGAAILPVALSVDRAFVFSSWDRFVLPRSGGRAIVKFLEPAIPRDRDDPEGLRMRLELDLSEATDRLDRELGLVIPS